MRICVSVINATDSKFGDKIISFVYLIQLDSIQLTLTYE